LGISAWTRHTKSKEGGVKGKTEGTCKKNDERINEVKNYEAEDSIRKGQKEKA